MHRRRTWIVGLALVACDDNEGAAGCPGEAVCGNGIVEAVEECEGATDCNACKATAPTVLVTTEAEVRSIAFAADGSWLAATVGIEGDGIVTRVRRFDPAGAELWSDVIVDPANSAVRVALDASGNAYVATAVQADVSADVYAWLGTWTQGGEPGWTVQSPDPGYYAGISEADGRIAVVGAEIHEDGTTTSLLRRFDDGGAVVWTVGDDTMPRFESVAFIGDELVVTGVPPQGDAHALRRYDALATMRWSTALPENDEQVGLREWPVLDDRDGGSWAVGAAAGLPYAVHHDRDGNALEVVTCIGGREGIVVAAALDSEHRLALAVQSREPDRGPRLWYPVVEAGVVTHANAPWTSVVPGPVATAWRDDGRVIVWNESGDGFPGISRVASVSN